MNKIDKKTVVPIGWVFASFATVIAVVFLGGFWVSTVDFRLRRIEEKLGIPIYQSNVSISDDAIASMLKEKK